MKLNRKTITKHLLNAGIFFAIWMTFSFIFIPEDVRLWQWSLYGFALAIMNECTPTLIKRIKKYINRKKHDNFA
jgi:predicted tellurium resistance membrane protein TerC